MNSELRFFGGVGLAWLALGAGFNAWEQKIPAHVSSTRTPVEALFAATGNMQPLVADWFWLKANLAWEQCDEATTRALTRLAVAAEPETRYFRFNAARMAAYDFPAWRTREEPNAPAAVQARWRSAAADEAISLVLDQAPVGPAEWIEAGNLAWRGKGDLPTAADHFRRAAEMEGAPWHAGRIYAELLCRMGRRAEALRWLQAWLPKLPADEPAAQRERVEAWIADLTRETSAREPL